MSQPKSQAPQSSAPETTQTQLRAKTPPPLPSHAPKSQYGSHAPKSHHGFASHPPSSRPTTEGYDRQSFVLVLTVHEDLQKFLKMHLNRFFSHVVVVRTSEEALDHIQKGLIDVVICDVPLGRRALSWDLMRKLSQGPWRAIPVVHLDSPQKHVAPKEIFAYLCTGVSSVPLNIEELHTAIRRALKVRPLLKTALPLLPTRLQMGELIHGDVTLNAEPRVLTLIAEIAQELSVTHVDP